jgi:hypothetical protein
MSLKSLIGICEHTWETEEIRNIHEYGTTTPNLQKDVPECIVKTYFLKCSKCGKRMQQRFKV